MYKERMWAAQVRRLGPAPSQMGFGMNKPFLSVCHPSGAKLRNFFHKLRRPLFELALALSLGFCASASAGVAQTVNFDHAQTGSLPPNWAGTKTGQGEPKWAVVTDHSAPSKPNVLKQSGEATYPVCIKEDASVKDGFVEVKFKPVSGQEDQAGGVIWRCQDADNYYVARANALEDNVTIYHTIKGKRVAFKNVDAKVESGVWHALRVDFEGKKFTVSLDGKKVIEATDDRFSEAGKVGVWTKADSVTLFDDFTFGNK